MSRREHAKEAVAEVVTEAGESLDALVQHVKPHLRGWLHLAMVPVSVAAAAVLFALSRGEGARASVVVFGLTAVLLFSTSAFYHRGRWNPRVAGVLKRWDHANIFLIIAGSYTPFALMLPRRQAITLLLIVWSGAIMGVLFRVLWIGAPRWLYVPVYVALGFVAVFYIKPLLTHGGWTILAFVIAGGALYTAGALVYGFKRPNPSPRWFGFHEIFHTLTVLAFISHFVAATLALFGPIAQTS